MGSNKKQSTYSLDADIRQQFKIETMLNGVDMSETIENFMSTYIKASKELRAERELKNANNV